jgi:hypothetical protein
VSFINTPYTDSKEGVEKEMAGTKYGKYILRGTKEKDPSDKPGVRTRTLDGLKDWAGIHHRLNWRYVSKPAMVVDVAHSHDFDEFLCFIGCDPSNPEEFGAEVEISMGKEGEKKIITTPTIICLPKGMVHGPINFTKVKKDVIFCNIYLSPEYIRIPA